MFTYFVSLSTQFLLVLCYLQYMMHLFPDSQLCLNSGGGSTKGSYPFWLRKEEQCEYLSSYTIRDIILGAEITPPSQQRQQIAEIEKQGMKYSVKLGSPKEYYQSIMRNIDPLIS